MDYAFTQDRPIYLQLMEHLKREIVSGILPPGGRMPSVRELAGQLGISPNTVQRAMYEMERTGLIESLGTEGRIVTQDAGCIETVRKALAQETLGIFYREMRQLGFEDREILRFAEEYSSMEHDERSEE